MDLKNSILATLAYYDIFDYPLTCVEVYEHLINPVRISSVPTGISAISLIDVMNRLEQLSQARKIQEHDGFYALPNRARQLYELRLERQKISDQKFKKLLRAAWWLQAVPYLRGLFISGSLAMANSTRDGDFDVLVVVKAGRLYTCRILLSLATSLMGMRRTRYDLEAPDKFCFNHYITHGDLRIEHESIYTAHIYSSLVPVFARRDIDSDFYSANAWLNKYFFNFRPVLRPVNRRVAKSRTFLFIANIFEIIFDTHLGHILETAGRSYQQKRIQNNPITVEPGGRTVCTDKRLEFHPRSFELVAIRRYNEAIRRLNILPPAPEADSGLLSL